ncbi:hypothetical protein [Amycolatopsis sp. Hca4]|uniref:hypothetical protein n=1 Tax=Amycolatopsis sp. Hca4 TaxID=2742131 RepID=UPI0015914CA5|nr:hypothetical protein [Amycolatopsis sp. Hca4]QKV75299.1 hypothetical protein HUT10_17115 [Amycolatopsis sp. Hca4]
MTDELEEAQLGPLGTELGRGGQAVVHLLPELQLPDVAGSLVYKRYFGQQSAPHGLRAIVRVRSALDQRGRERLDTIASWPARVVRKDGVVVGVVMPLIHESFFQKRVLPGSGRAVNDPREVQNLFVEPSLAVRLGMPPVTTADRLAFCRDFAGALAFLHGRGVVFGDVNAKNALFRRAPEPTVMLVDCDAVRIKGSAAVVRQLSAPDWAPPEGTILTQATDVYKLGLFVLRALTPGPQASTARDPDRLRELFDPAGQQLLRATLGENAQDRPRSAEWYAYLAKQTPQRRHTVVARKQSEPARRTTTSGWRRNRTTGGWERAT